MKVLFATIFLALTAISNAATWNEILAPNDTQILKSCNDGTRIESMARVTVEQKEDYQSARSKALIGLNLTDSRAMSNDPLARLNSLISSIRIQTPSGSAYNICGNSAQRLENQPPISSIPRTILVYVGGRTKELRDAQQFNAVLSLLDKTGNEISRIQPSKTLKASTDWWRSSCSSNPCTWVGENIFHYSISPALAADLKKTNTVRLIFTRGNGVEQRDYATNDFNGLTLADRPATSDSDAVQPTPGVRYMKVEGSGIGMVSNRENGALELMVFGKSITFKSGSKTTAEGFILSGVPYIKDGDLMPPIDSIEFLGCKVDADSDIYSYVCPNGNSGSIVPANP